MHKHGYHRGEFHPSNQAFERSDLLLAEHLFFMGSVISMHSLRFHEAAYLKRFVPSVCLESFTFIP